jgi:hypothetical protein
MVTLIPLSSALTLAKKAEVPYNQLKEKHFKLGLLWVGSVYV